MAVTRSPPYPPAHPTTTHIVYCSFSHCSLISSGRIVLMSLSIVRNAILISAKFLPACWRDFWASLIREASNLALFIILCTCVWCVVGEEGTSLNINIINDEGVGWKDSVCVCVCVCGCVYPPLLIVPAQPNMLAFIWNFLLLFDHIQPQVLGSHIVLSRLHRLGGNKG